MKKCPKCSAVYEDDTILRCIYCGTSMVEDISDQETVSQDANQPPIQPQQPTIPYQYPNGGYIPASNYQGYNPNYNQNYTPVRVCPYCGNQCDVNAVLCVRCGAQLPPITNGEDKTSGVLSFFSFIIPMVGLILYAMYSKDKPKSSKSYGRLALIGFIIQIILYVFLYILLMIVIPLIFTMNTSAEYYEVYEEGYYSMMNLLSTFLG